MEFRFGFYNEKSLLKVNILKNMASGFPLPLVYVPFLAAAKLSFGNNLGVWNGHERL